MIYLIRVKYEKITLLKIGYTGDSKKDTRYVSYKLHNPLMEILYEIPEGTEEDEKYLHTYFSEFKYSDYGNEWFISNDSILEYFSTHKTKDSLQDLRDTGLVLKIKSLTQFKKLVESIINRVLNLKIDSGDITLEQSLNQVESMTNCILYNHRIRSESRLWSFIENIFGYNKADIFPDLGDRVSEFLRDFDKLSFFTEKMKFLCESNLTSEELSSVLETIFIEYKNYYITLGPDKIKSLSYQRSKLKIEYEKKKNNQLGDSDLVNLVYSIFIVGNKYTKPYIKQTFSSIYNKLGIQTTPKAVDIEKYFEVRLVDVIDETGKRTKGFKLLEKIK